MDFSKHLHKADQALERRNFDYAIELYRQLIDLDPDLGEARGGLRRALRAKHERSPGGRLRRLAAGALPLGRARTLRRMGRPEACARALEDYLLSNPLDEEANLALGEALEEAGHHRSARAVYEFLSEIAPRNPEGWKRAGAMLRLAGEATRALECYERALAIDPRDRDALRARKDLAAETALSRREAPEVRHSRDLIPEPEDGAAGERARPASRTSHTTIPRTTRELAEERERIAALVAEAPDDPALRGELAELCRRLGELEPALEHAREALRLQPDSPLAARRAGELGTLFLARRLAAAEEQGDAPLAARLAAELREHELADWRLRSRLSPADPAAAVGLARALLAAGQPDPAIAELQRVQKDARVRVEALTLLGRAFREKGLSDLAVRSLEGALEEAQAGSAAAKEILYDLGSLAGARGDAEGARSFYVRIIEIDIGYRDVAEKLKTL